MKRVGFEVQIATDGTEAVDIINAAPAGYFDCVLIDIQAPNTEGYEVCRQIRNLDESDKASIPIVAVTADVFRNQSMSLRSKWYAAITNLSTNTRLPLIEACCQCQCMLTEQAAVSTSLRQTAVRTCGHAHHLQRTSRRSAECQ